MIGPSVAGCAHPSSICSPQVAKPILVDQTRYQYPIVPDARRRQTMEIYFVDEVVSTDAETHETVTYHPLYSERHAVQGTSPATGTSRARSQTARVMKELMFFSRWWIFRLTDAVGLRRGDGSLHVHEPRSRNSPALRQ